MHTYPKKKLGQNFLVDKNIRRKILENCRFSKNDTVLEIGAGRGEMTTMIVPLVKRLVSIEIDRDLCKYLKLRLKNFDNTELVCGDILKIDISRRFKSKSLTVFGNIPYYLTTPIITHLIKYRKNIKCIYMTVQKEFGRRIVASPGSKDYSSFTIYCNYYLEPRPLFVIPKGCFYPIPKVDSAFLEMSVRKRPSCRVGNEEFFFKIVRTAFNQRRKTLKNALKKIVEPEKLLAVLSKRGINPNARAEELNLADFAFLSRHLI